MARQVKPARSRVCVKPISYSRTSHTLAHVGRTPAQKSRQAALPTTRGLNAIR